MTLKILDGGKGKKIDGVRKPDESSGSFGTLGDLFGEKFKISKEKKLTVEENDTEEETQAELESKLPTADEFAQRYLYYVENYDKAKQQKEAGVQEDEFRTGYFVNMKGSSDLEVLGYDDKTGMVSFRRHYYDQPDAGIDEKNRKTEEVPYGEFYRLMHEYRKVNKDDYDVDDALQKEKEIKLDGKYVNPWGEAAVLGTYRKGEVKDGVQQPGTVMTYATGKRPEALRINDASELLENGQYEQIDNQAYKGYIGEQINLAKREFGKKGTEYADKSGSRKVAILGYKYDNSAEDHILVEFSDSEGESLQLLGEADFRQLLEDGNLERIFEKSREKIVSENSVESEQEKPMELSIEEMEYLESVYLEAIKSTIQLIEDYPWEQEDYPAHRIPVEIEIQKERFFEGRFARYVKTDDYFDFVSLSEEQIEEKIKKIIEFFQEKI